MADEKNRADGDSSSLEKEKFDTALYRPGDISAEKRAEALAEWVDGALAILDQKGNVLEFNEPMAAWLDEPRAPLAGRSFWELLAARCPDWAGAVKELRRGEETFAQVRLRQPLAGGATVAWFTLEVARRGATLFVRCHSSLPPLVDLEESTWDEHLRSEPARREMFVRLVRAEAQLQRLTERWPGVVFSQRADFTFRFVSPQIETLTGVPPAVWHTKSDLFWQVVHEADAEELRRQLRQARETRQPLTVTYRIRHTATGRITYVLEHRQTNVSRGGLLLGYEGVWLDVTRQTIAEKSLATAASKETLSALTMGLAHDFGNVMAGIHALSETFLEQVGGEHDFSEGLALIKRNAHQASQLVHRIINLHQGRTGETHYHNLNELATDLGDLVRKILPRRMQFAVELAPQPLPVHLDAVELRQVVINLVLNAVEATPGKGRLVLRTTADAPATPPRCVQGSFPRPPLAGLVIADSGCGIPTAHLPGLFEPFFTTKPAHKGSGLGLYNARVFVERHHGALAVDTQEGVGSTFQLWLPQADFTEPNTANTGSSPGANVKADAGAKTDAGPGTRARPGRARARPARDP